MLNSLNWGELTPEIFLKDYWQKKPLIIKKAFENFQDTICADELAGLAMETEIESRIVSFTEQQNTDKTWQVDHGPFEDFTAYGDKNWTLLVQAVNNWSKQTHDLLSHFSFIPRWRIDDVMVSFSTPHGGVGAHLDQYDVFIIQGSGKRRWQVGKPNKNLQTRLPHPDLKQVSTFETIIDEETEAGDLLYIPPNHPHNGISLENSLNFSIGFQAPSSQELWSSFADKLIDNNQGEDRFCDATDSTPLKASYNNTSIDHKALTQLKMFMLKELHDEERFERFIGEFLTQNHHPLEVLIPVEVIDTKKLTDILTENTLNFSPVLGIKSAIINEKTTQFFINGESFFLNDENFQLAQHLAKDTPISAEKMKQLVDNEQSVHLLLSILNKGFWFVDG